MLDISHITEAIRGETLDGWLFCNFSHRDRLTDQFLGLDTDTVSTRSWFYIIPDRGEPVKLVHSMETAVLDPLPGVIRTYTGRDDLSRALSAFSGHRLAVLSDKTITILSTVSAEQYALAESCGIILHSAASLIQRLSAFQTDDDYSSHHRAAAVLYEAVRGAWDIITQQLKAGRSPSEGDIRQYLASCIAKAGMCTNHLPIVAAGANTANPHYDIPAESTGTLIRPGNLVQFDLWGKYPGGMYADISWVGFTGETCPEDYADRFRLICGARDLVVPAISAAFFSSQKAITGADIDALVRNFLTTQTEPGQIIDPAWIRHRTGHAIDHECHGSGVNLDSVEFPDTRQIIEGSCFSIEPGIYCDRYGMRTEINAYVKNGIPVVSTVPVQKTILLLQD